MIMEKDKDPDEGVFKIRDIRNQPFIWIEKAALFYILQKGTPTTFAVYGLFCYHASFKNQECFLKMQTLADRLKVSRRTILRQIKILETLRLIKVIHNKGKGKRNEYQILRVPRSAIQEVVDKPVNKSFRCDMGVTPGVSLVSHPYNEQYLLNKKNLKSTDPSDPAVEKLLKTVFKKGFNPGPLLAKWAQENPGVGAVPDVVLKRVLERYLTDSAANIIRSPWPWFKAVLRREYQDHRHLWLKQAPAGNIGAILRGMSEKKG